MIILKLLWLLIKTPYVYGSKMKRYVFLEWQLTYINQEIEYVDKHSWCSGSARVKIVNDLIHERIGVERELRIVREQLGLVNA